MCKIEELEPSRAHLHGFRNRGFFLGFTLVELLVVIAIIALLMSILMPALAKVRAQAKAVLCLSNLKQWGMCYSMYADDNDGYFMPGWTELFVPCEDVWMEALRPYYMNAGALRMCPTTTKCGTDVGGGPYGGWGTFVGWGVFDGGWYPPVVPGDYGSYGGNAYVYNPAEEAIVIETHPTSNNWRSANVKGTAYIPLFLDAQWWDGWPHQSDNPPLWDGQPWSELGTEHTIRFCINRHEGSINAVFLDYSVRKVGLKELWKIKWHRTYDLDGPWTEAGGVQADDWPEWMRNFKDY